MPRFRLHLAALAATALATYPALASGLVGKNAPRSNGRNEAHARANRSSAHNSSPAGGRGRFQRPTRSAAKPAPIPQTGTQPSPGGKAVQTGRNRFAFEKGNRFEVAIPRNLVTAGGGVSPDEIIDIDIACPENVPVETRLFAPGVRGPVATARGIGSCKLSCRARDLARGTGSCKLVLQLNANPADVKGTVTVNRATRPRGDSSGRPIRPFSQRPQPPDSNPGSSSTSGLPDLKVRTIGLFRGRRNPTTGAVTLDTDPADTDLTASHLTISIDNCGLAAFDGAVDLRILALASLSGDSFSYDKTLRVPLSLGSGKHTQIPFPLAQSPWGRPENPGDSLPWGFVWPDLIDHPKLTFAAYIDPRDHVSESNEKNNFFQKEFAIPCGVRIDKVRGDAKVDLRYEKILTLLGRFGNRQACKQVYIDRNGQRHRLDVTQWTDSKLVVYVPQRLSTGQYFAAVYTTDPSAQPTYRSNPVQFKIVRSEEPDPEHLDARELANALAEEYSDWLSFENGGPKIQRIWLDKLTGGLPNHYTVYCRYRPPHEHKTLCEIFKNGQKVFSLKLRHENVPDEEPDQPGVKLARRQVVLQPGDYLVRFTVFKYDWDAQEETVYAKMSWQLTAHP